MEALPKIAAHKQSHVSLNSNRHIANRNAGESNCGHFIGENASKVTQWMLQALVTLTMDG